MASAIRRVTEFLCERNQQVVADGGISQPGAPLGTVLGPTLFFIYINDIAENINSNIRLFADDCVVYGQIDSPQDHLILHEDLNKLVEWSVTWEFNIDKYVIMNIGTLRNKSKFEYKMKTNNNKKKTKKKTLEVVKHHPYLGVELTDNMKYNQGGYVGRERGREKF